MKKFFFILWAIALGSFLSFTSCGDKDSVTDDTLGIGDISKLNDYKYSDLSEEKQKEKLQEDANGFLSELQGLKTNDGIKVLKTFNSLLETSSPETSVFDPQQSSLRSVNDILKISDLYGKFTWNASKKDWDKAESGKELEFNFPVGNQTGRITVSGVSSGVTTPAESEDDEYGYLDIPKEVSGKIYLGNSEVSSLHATTTIKDANKVPTLTELTYTLGEYTLSSSVSTTNSNVATSTFKKGKTILIDAVADLSGNLDNLLKEDDITGQGNVIIRIMNKLAFAGTVDATNYGKAINQADDNWKKDKDQYGWEKADENFTKASSKAFNDYWNLFLVSLTDNYKIATLKNKAVLYDGYWEEVAVLRFNDNTEVEAEVFFSSGFDVFFKNLEDFIHAF
jgi:hypothetical protein